MNANLCTNQDQMAENEKLKSWRTGSLCFMKNPSTQRCFYFEEPLITSSGNNFSTRTFEISLLELSVVATISKIST